VIARSAVVRPDRARVISVRRPATVAAAILGSATYSAFLFASLGPSRLPVATSFPSELEATGQPYSAWFRVADAVSGLLILAAVVGIYRLGEVSRRHWRAGMLMAAAGAASVTDSITTMSCAPSLSSACRARDNTVTGLLGQTLESHTLSGLVGFLGAAGGMVLLGFAVRDRAAAWAAASITTGFVLAGVGLIDVALLVAHGPFGLAERARALLVSLWLLGLAGFLCRLNRPRTVAANRLASWAGDPGG
jgi:hypothetical protein